MPFFYNWRLYDWGDCAAAEGLVTAHISSRFYDGREVRTSAIVKVEVAEGALRLTTQSGSVYGLMPEAIDPDPERGAETAQCLAPFGVAPDFIEDCLRAREEADRRAGEEEPRLIAPGELLLVTVGVTALRGLFHAQDGKVTTVRPWPHVGMFTDSILLTDWDGGTVDFRYFPLGRRIEPYHISDGIETIKVKNLGRISVLFGRGDNEVRCEAGEVTAIPMADHPYEGLISPDVVNGKSLLKPKEEGGQENG